MESYILDIFYNDFINEVITGKIDCYFKFNVMFYIYIKEDDEFILPNNDSLKGIIKPILIINDKEKFNKLLVKYINIAMNYYNNDDYIQDLKGIENELYYKIKMIMTLLWSNATIDDFNEPEKYIQRRINHLNNIFEEETISLGYSEIMDTDIYVKFKRERIVNETPNSIVFKCIKDDEEYIYFQQLDLE